MLQLELKEADICRISKLLARYNIKARIFNRTVILDGRISDDLLSKLNNELIIETVQNFSNAENNTIAEILNDQIQETLEEKYCVKTNTNSSNDPYQKKFVKTKYQSYIIKSRMIDEYDLVYPKVKRGEVYLCDFGEPYCSEEGFIRYAIVIQTDKVNENSPTTIVIPCTTQKQKKLPTNYEYIFSDHNMIDYDEKRVGERKMAVALGTQIRTVDKTRLRRYIGTVKPEFMEGIQKIIDTSLDLKREKRIINREIEKKLSQNSVSENPKKEKDGFNDIQMRILENVDKGDLLYVCQQDESDKIKIRRILKLFGFNTKKKGIDYLIKAILVSLKMDYFNLETLSNTVATNVKNVRKEEVQRLIVARVKEQFKLKKSPAIDFIRLINILLKINGSTDNEKISSYSK